MIRGGLGGRGGGREPFPKSAEAESRLRKVVGRGGRDRNLGEDSKDYKEEGYGYGR